MKVLIIGGGIGGLTTALCCLHFGHEVKVFEKAQKFGEVGAGIQLPPNAMKVFAALGVQETVAKQAFKPVALEARMGLSGRNIFKVPLSEKTLEGWGAPYLHIHRADYIKALRTCLLERSPGSLQLESEVIGYKQDSENVAITFINGQTETGDILIGADGIKSGIRDQMLGPDQAEFTGNVAWRAVVPINELGPNIPNPTACVWMGAGRHAVTYRLQGGALANFVGVVEQSDWTTESWTEPGSKSQALSDFQGWHPKVSTLIQAAKPGQLYRWALFDRKPLSQWTDGRVALLGDAAHPMLPFMAQGAAMAVEDAWVLAREISESSRAAEDSLTAYQKNRLGRTSAAQLASRNNMKTFHRSGRWSQLSTYGPMWLAARIMPSLIPKRFDWLYGYDVTQSA